MPRQMRGSRIQMGRGSGGEEGYMLVGLVVAIFLILLLLGVAAPRVARSLRREKEVESMHRAEQYVRAIQVYYRKLGHYPGSIEQLEKTNNQRFLRQKYVDPLTGKADWKLIQLGQAKTTVKGFFGQPLAGLPTTGLGSAAGMASAGGTGTQVGASSTASAFGSGSSSFASGSNGGGTGSSFGSSSASGGASLGSASGGTGSGSGAGTSSTTGGGAGSTISSGGIGSQSATSFTGGGAPFLGVGSAASGDSIVVVNEQTTYPTWEFLYDPRVEQMKAKVSLFGGGPASTSASGSGLGSGFGTPVGSGIGSSTAPGTGTGTSLGASGSATGTGSATGAGSTTGTGSTNTTPQ